MIEMLNYSKAFQSYIVLGVIYLEDNLDKKIFIVSDVERDSGINKTEKKNAIIMVVLTIAGLVIFVLISNLMPLFKLWWSEWFRTNNYIGLYISLILISVLILGICFLIFGLDIIKLVENHKEYLKNNKISLDKFWKIKLNGFCFEDDLYKVKFVDGSERVYIKLLRGSNTTNSNEDYLRNASFITDALEEFTSQGYSYSIYTMKERTDDDTSVFDEYEENILEIRKDNPELAEIYSSIINLQKEITNDFSFVLSEVIVIKAEMDNQFSNFKNTVNAFISKFKNTYYRKVFVMNEYEIKKFYQYYNGLNLINTFESNTRTYSDFSILGKTRILRVVDKNNDTLIRINKPFVNINNMASLSNMVSIKKKKEKEEKNISEEMTKRDLEIFGKEIIFDDNDIDIEG